MAGGDRSPAANSHRKRKADTDDGGTKADVITLLRAAIEFKNRTGAAPTPTTMASFYGDVKGMLRSPIPQEKVYNKFRTLRHNLNQAASGGRGGGSDDDQVLKLSAELWSQDKDKERKDKKGKKKYEEESKGQKKKKKPKKEEKKVRKEEEVKKRKDDSDTEMEDGQEDEEKKGGMKDIDMDEEAKKKMLDPVPSNDSDDDVDSEDDNVNNGQEQDGKEKNKVENKEDEDDDEDDEEDEDIVKEGETDKKKAALNGGKLQLAWGNEARDVKKENHSKVKELKEGKERGVAPDACQYVTNVAAEYWKSHGLSNVSLDEALKSVDISKVRALEEKLKKHFNEELRLQLDWGKLNREILESLIQTHKSM